MVLTTFSGSLITPKKILQNETANADLVLTAAYLHDVFDDKLTDEVAGHKADVRRQLIAFGYDTAEINEIFYIIEHMSFSANLEQHYALSIEGQIVQDADRLDALGALGIARLFAFGGVSMIIRCTTQMKHKLVIPRLSIGNHEPRLITMKNG